VLIRGQWVSFTSGLNAIAHAVEALYAEDRNPITSLMAQEAIGALARALPRIVADPRHAEARGTCLGAVGMALHHKLCHVLGGSLDLPHAETHAIIPPIPPHALARTAAGSACPPARVPGRPGACWRGGRAFSARAIRVYGG